MAVITTQHKFEITKLPSETKKKWVDALRSGTYLQGGGSLFDFKGAISDEDKGSWGNTYCCLGVLGEVCGIPEEELEGKEFLNGMSELPEEIELFSANVGLQQMLADNNDGLVVEETDSQEIGEARIIHSKATFLELADWIEENL